ncbi:MAG: UbiA family prenyltransferase [Arhodomonas sp.]|nr:UbiA family prenyltransferase [Arhodomonas sp.]
MLWLVSGRAELKAQLARRTGLDVNALPYRSSVLELAREAQQADRAVILATATHERLARRIAQHIGLFTEVLATAGTDNLKGIAKRDVLVQRFGEGDFDYVADDRSDLPVWSAARKAVLINPSRAVAKHIRRTAADVDIIRDLPPWLPTLITQVRAHQWLKNTLIALPLLAAHGPFTAETLIALAAAFLSFSLCASGVYCLNDLVDLEADRRSPAKAGRPLAAGALPLGQGIAAGIGLPLLGLAVAAVSLPASFLLVLAVYLLLTTTYSLWLKQLVLIDAVILAMLYTLRIIAGGEAVDVALSDWLFAFSLFLFWSLALVKRYTELIERRADGEESAPGRGYSDSDTELLPALGGAAGFIAVLVLALYIQSSHTAELYTHPRWLWLACPVLLYWISRTWLLAHRRQMHDDPLVYAITDPVSLGAGTTLLVIFVLAL